MGGKALGYDANGNLTADAANVRGSEREGVNVRGSEREGVRSFSVAPRCPGPFMSRTYPEGRHRLPGEAGVGSFIERQGSGLSS